jgi:GTP-binding protein
MDDDELNAGNSAEEDDGLDFFDDEEDFPCDYDSATDREVIPLADLDEPGSHVVVARGGRGGLGSCLYSSRYALPDAETLVKSAQPGPGEVAFLELELKLIADLGFVGFPNAGKSSLLRALSAATPEVAPYPFTTLHPTVGCIDYRDGFRIRAADIPGLIDGSADGRGKGHDFLRHIERTKALLYMVDGAGTDYRDPVEDLRVLARELASYGDGSLMSRRALVVVNKTDLLHKERVEELISSLEDAAEEIGIEVDDDVLGISAGVTGQGLPSLAEAIRDIVGRSDEDRRLLFSSEESV